MIGENERLALFPTDFFFASFNFKFSVLIPHFIRLMAFLYTESASES